MKTFNITTRDREICRMLYEQRVLTTEQIADLYFDSLRRTRRRLQILAQRNIIERFRPHRPSGSYPWHWILGELGAKIVAAERGVDLRQLGYRKDRAMAYAFSPRLAHLLAVNGFMCRLSRACRDRTDLHLTDWVPEHRCGEALSGLVRPDGIGVLDNGRERVRFAVELDRGTENGSRLEEKLNGYVRISRFREAPKLLAFVFPSERREAEARRHLHNAGMTVATTTLSSAMTDPLGAIWLPIRGERRSSIVDLLFRGADE